MDHLEKFNYEQDITKEECIDKRNSFFKCVIEKKNELTKGMTNENWKNYNNLVNTIALKCFDEKGLKKCGSYFNFYDITY
jgi:hypothetical protein